MTTVYGIGEKIMIAGPRPNSVPLQPSFYRKTYPLIKTRNIKEVTLHSNICGGHINKCLHFLSNLPSMHWIKDKTGVTENA